MSKPIDDLLETPSITSREGETLYRWNNTLAVLVLASGEIGQFTTTLPWKRAQVEDFLASRGLG